MTPQAVPRTQRAIVHSRYGAARDVLALSGAFPVHAPGAQQVQVQIRAAAVNPIDWQMIEGNRRLITRRRFPFTPLFDLAGVVTAVGDEVTSFRVGDRVHADNEIDAGGASEYVNVREDLLAPVPAGLAFTEAAAIPLAAQTALTCLDRGRVGPGTRVAVIGASGGVGHFAVQMAHAAGAFVAGVAGARNREFVHQMGADVVIDRHRTDLLSSFGADSFDVVIDCVGGREQWTGARQILRPGGRFVTIARDEDGVVTPASAARLLSTITARRLRGAGARGRKYHPVFLKASGALLRRVNERVEAGQVRVHLSGSFPLTLEGVRAAIEESRAGRTTGKLVLRR
ncbi:NAD(P)-dependent alcohol dehydrogenase [Streptomyces apricus]|uniref:NAD(P)-dependent alcohol dehydrogenase n=1 Tax=Streptomyces apricus TaxID=1828112 RepID=A0A5B0BAU5_9ACTN|nr:NAD(P)-dependent alcohol dehydrogenase [Streptomyces apricus]KAA0938721.1 NAD(P)-dependent alcohol dehydrogenase [Streptomyces apricus]